MSIPSPTGAKLLNSLNIKSFLFFIITLLSFGIVSILLQTHVYAESDKTQLKEVINYQYDLTNPTHLLLTTDIESNLFRPNYLHIYGEDFDYAFFSYATTVEEAVNEVEFGFKFEFDDDDLFSPELSEDIRGNMWIKFTRVDNEFEEIKTKIPFKTSNTIDLNLLAGRQNIIIEGKVGELTDTYKITYEDGIKINRELLSSIVTIQPIEKVVANGAKLVSTKTCTEWDEEIDLQTSDLTERFWLKFVMRCESGCNENNISSTGAYKGLFQYSTNTFFSPNVGNLPNGNPYSNIFDGQQQISQTLVRYRGGQGSSDWPTCGPKAQAVMPDFSTN